MLKLTNNAAGIPTNSAMIPLVSEPDCRNGSGTDGMNGYGVHSRLARHDVGDQSLFGGHIEGVDDAFERDYHEYRPRIGKSAQRDEADQTVSRLLLLARSAPAVDFEEIDPRPHRQSARR